MQGTRNKRTRVLASKRLYDELAVDLQSHKLKHSKDTERKERKFLAEPKEQTSQAFEAYTCYAHFSCLHCIRLTLQFNESMKKFWKQRGPLRNEPAHGRGNSQLSSHGFLGHGSKFDSRPQVFNVFGLGMCFAPQQPVLFRHRSVIESSKSAPNPTVVYTFHF